MPATDGIATIIELRVVFIQYIVLHATRIYLNLERKYFVIAFGYTPAVCMYPLYLTLCQPISQRTFVC